jgi:hypothetical protein
LSSPTVTTPDFTPRELSSADIESIVQKRRAIQRRLGGF